MSVIPFHFRHVAAFVPKVETAGDLRQVTPAPFNRRCSRTVASWSGLHPSTETLTPILVHPRHIPAGSLPSLGSGWPGVCTITDPESPGTPYGSVFRDTEFSPRVSPAINITSYGSFIRLHKIPVGTFSALLPHMSPYFSPHSAARVPCTFQAGVLCSDPPSRWTVTDYLGIHKKSPGPHTTSEIHSRHGRKEG